MRFNSRITTLSLIVLPMCTTLAKLWLKKKSESPNGWQRSPKKPFLRKSHKKKKRNAMRRRLSGQLKRLKKFRPLLSVRATKCTFTVKISLKAPNCRSSLLSIRKPLRNRRRSTRL